MWVLFNKYYLPGKISILNLQESLVLLLFTGVPTKKIKFGKKGNFISGNVDHNLTEAKGFKRCTKKCCGGCYDLISANERSKGAALTARKVSTYCESFEGVSFLCLSCFKVKHSS